jgi:hypothetical protein
VDVEAWRRRSSDGPPTPPVRQPPPGLRPSRRSQPKASIVPMPPPMPLEDATPPPVMAPPPPMAEMEIPDFTAEIDPVPAPAVWKQAHPSAMRWAERRQGGATRRTPSPPRVVLGLLIVGLGAWLLLSFLPERKPLTQAERARVNQQAGVDADAWRFDRVGYQAARGGAALYLTLGALVALRGLTFRRRVETQCRRCGRPGGAARDGLRLRCETGQHSAGANTSAVALLAGFALVSVAILVLIAIASLG